MTSSLMLWLRYAGNAIAQRMAYRTEYLISLASMFILELAPILLTYVIYSNSPGFAGWSFHEVLLIQGIFLFIRGFSFSNFGGVLWNSNRMVQSGNFDLLLVRPRNTLFLMICESFDAEDIAKYIGGGAITLYALSNLPAPSFLGILGGLVAVVLGIGFFFALVLFFSAMIIRVTKMTSTYELLEIISMIGQYPKTIFPQSIALLLTGIFPIFIVALIPAQFLLGMFTTDILISGTATIILIIVSWNLWFSTLRRYTSAGG